MNKAKLFFSSFFLLIFLFLGTQILAAPTTPPTPSPSPATSATVSASNPGPPLGFTCGKTICLPTEVCTTYPGEVESHCVPAPLNLEPSPLAKDWDCEKKLGAGEGSFPMNQKTQCWNHFTNTQTTLDLYKKTCVYEPIVSYSDKRRLSSGDQPFIQCGKGTSGPGGPPAPSTIGPNCDVHMLANTDVRDAELGGYGPDASIAANFSSDFMSQNYLYNALFDRPNDLRNDNPKLNADGYSIKNREAYRTYWRLMPSSNQANLRSYTMNMADQKLISNIKFEYTSAIGKPETTTFKDVRNALKSQVILFGHFPFIRIGCLTSYPVCPEYAQAIKEIIPDFTELRLLASLFNVGDFFDKVIGVYQAANDAFKGDISGAYQSFVPLDFDSVRSYIVMKKSEGEKEAYDEHGLRDTLNAWRYPNGSDVELSNVSRESLPYIGAIYQGLLSPKFGMIPALEPQWIIDKYATPGAEFISDYKVGNTTADAPEVKLAVKGWLDTFVDESVAIILDPWSWLQNKFSQVVTSIFSPDSTQKIGYTANKTANIKELDKIDNEKVPLVDQYVNMQSCPMPVSYHLISPKTVPVNFDKDGGDDHHQVVTIPGKQIEWSFTPECRSKDQSCYIDPIINSRICQTEVCVINDEKYEENGQCCTRAWSVSGIKHGKTLTVLNNPKQTDIKNAVAGESQISLYDMLLPDGATKIPNAEIDAPIAKNTKTSGSGLATAPNGSGDVTNPGESIMRENNLAQDSIHFLQNCWTIPKELQNSPRCKYGIAPEASAGACGVAPILAPDASCKVKNNTLNLPPTLIAGIETAAKTFKVPPALFIAVIFGEGAFNPGSKFFDDAFVAENFKSCAVLPGCNPSEAWIKNIIPLYPGNWDRLKDAITEFDPSRVPNACNLLDGIFALAKDLSQNQYGSPAFAGKTCFGIPLNSGSGGSTTCNWSDSGAETAIRVWEFGTAYTPTLSCATKENSCLLGGGMAANCPAGGDTCETIGNRYPQASHNACLWDMYKSN